MFYPIAMPVPTQPERRAMARALLRAAELIDGRARQMDDRMAHWRKGRPGDPAPIEARMLHHVARDLRTWARRCWPAS